MAELEKFNPIINYLISSFEKIAIKEFWNNGIYVKIYSPLSHDEVYKRVCEWNNDSTLTISEEIQEPPFIEDGVEAIELMIYIAPL